MKNFIHRISHTFRENKIIHKLRGFIAPQFFAFFAFSLVLWYLVKLSYNYTTEFTIIVEGDKQEIETHCVAEGIGSKLLSYYIFNGGKLRIDLSEVSHKIKKSGKEEQITLNNSSLINALSMRYSDIKIISITDKEQ